MKKSFSILITSLVFIFTTNTFAQSNIEGILDKIVSLAGQKSEGQQIVSLLGTGVSVLEREANTGNAYIKSKLLGGKSSLSQNRIGIVRNLNLLKAGSSVLGSGVQNKFGKLLGSTTKSVGKLDKSGLFGKLAASVTNRKLGKLVSLVTSAL